MINENLELFFTDFGTTAVLNGGQSFPVLFGSRYDPIAELQADGRRITAVGKTSDLGGALQDDVLKVDGVEYLIASVEPIQDGKFTLVRLING